MVTKDMAIVTLIEMVSREVVHQEEELEEVGKTFYQLLSYLVKHKNSYNVSYF